LDIIAYSLKHDFRLSWEWWFGGKPSAKPPHD
jgi:hypothetical protein